MSCLAEGGLVCMLWNCLAGGHAFVTLDVF
jgi:hypothetical protein